MLRGWQWRTRISRLLIWMGFVLANRLAQKHVVQRCLRKMRKEISTEEIYCLNHILFLQWAVNSIWFKKKYLFCVGGKEGVFHAWTNNESHGKVHVEAQWLDLHTAFIHAAVMLKYYFSSIITFYLSKNSIILFLQTYTLTRVFINVLNVQRVRDLNVDFNKLE